jgi:hypothetical protein
MEDDFYASIKLKTGEEIFARVIPCKEHNKYILLVTNPIVIVDIEYKKGRSGYKIEPWMKTTREDTFIINMDDVITISENKDIVMINLHQSYTNKISLKKDDKLSSVSREMGYLSNVRDAKRMLENIYKNS